MTWARGAVKVSALVQRVGITVAAGGPDFSGHGHLGMEEGMDGVIVDRERLATSWAWSRDGSFVALGAGGFCDAS